jgi:dTDP-4-amino-4,6-dideoxygalactose transaminase
MSWRIPLSDLNYGPEEEAAVLQVLRSKWLTMGPRTEEFEHRAASYLGVKHAIAVTNCTCALELVYKFVIKHAPMDRPPNSDAAFIMPSLTFVATANAALVQGGIPVLCDIENVSRPLLSPERVREAIESSGAKPHGIVTVHFAGFDANSAQLAVLAAEHNIPLIEDAAHGIGGNAANRKPLGTTGFAGCFSFFSNKNLATGEGGLVATDDDALAGFVRASRCHGVTASTYDRHKTASHGYDVILPGHNFRCTEITAALGIEQLKKLDSGNARRRAIYGQYINRLRDKPHVFIPFADETGSTGQSACHVFPLLCESTGLRDKVRQALTDNGIQTSHHYPPVHTFSYFAELPHTVKMTPRPLTATEDFASRELTLPLYPDLSDNHIDEICAVIAKTVGPN